MLKLLITKQNSLVNRNGKQSSHNLEILFKKLINRIKICLMNSKKQLT